MHMFTQEQRFLLSGIARLSVQIHQIDDMTVYSMKDQHRKLVLKRAIKALLHDAAQETVNLEGYLQHCFRSAVKEACTPRTAIDERAFCTVWCEQPAADKLVTSRNMLLAGRE